MFGKLIQRITSSLEVQLKAESAIALERIGYETREALAKTLSAVEVATESARASAQDNLTKLSNDYNSRCAEYDKLSREIEKLTSVAEDRRKELLFQTQRIESEITVMRAGTPDRLYESAFNSGFSKGFDLALALQKDELVKYVDRRIHETSEKERARYDQAIAKLHP